MNKDAQDVVDALAVCECGHPIAEHNYEAVAIEAYQGTCSHPVGTGRICGCMLTYPRD